MKNFLKNNFFEIALDKNWHEYKKDDATCFFCGYLISINLEKSQAAEYILKKYISNREEFENEIEKIIGNFSFIIVENDNLFSAVDHYCSFPVYYSEKKEKIYLYSNPIKLKKELELDFKDINFSSCFVAARSGFTLDRFTIYKSIKFIEAGKFLRIKKKKNNLVELNSYFKYYPEIDQIYKNKLSQQSRIEELSCLFSKIFLDLINSAKGRQIVVFLSGGLDSRLIVCGLKKFGYKNVLCVSYGIKNNWEAFIGKKVANALEYDWQFVEINSNEASVFYNSEVFKFFFKFSDDLISAPVVHELLVLNKIKESLEKDAIIINGQSGDFITGNHIPEVFNKDLGDNNIYKRKKRFARAFIEKNCNLWESLTNNQQDTIKLEDKIWQNINSEIEISDDHKNDYQLYEYFEWKTRQARYLVRNQRVYEFFNFDWRLPLWDQRLVKFFLYANFEEKYQQDLYKKFLYQKNWCNVWKKYPDKWFVQGWVLYTRSILKYSLGILVGKNKWKQLDKRLFNWWNDNQFKYSVVSYNHWLFEKRKPRNAQSLWTEKWLSSHGLDWTGK